MPADNHPLGALKRGAGALMFFVIGGAAVVTASLPEMNTAVGLALALTMLGAGTVELHNSFIKLRKIG